MPKRTDIHKILIIGSGPIVIGQACEFDYSGTQACKALKEEGYEVVLVNSNPATIMTDPELADRTYIEPITPEIVAKIIEKERPDALLPTLGGQTGLNTAVAGGRDGRAGEVRRGDDRRHPDGHQEGRGPRTVPRGHGAHRPAHVPRAAIATIHGGGPGRGRTRSASRSSSGPASPWAAPAAAWPTTRRNSKRSPSRASTPA